MNELLEWSRQAGGFSGVEGLAIEPVSGDASFRTYHRLTGIKPTVIAVNSPPATEKNREFVAISALLRQAGVCAPEVLAVDYDRGFMLLSDLGNRLLLPELCGHTVDAYYRQAMDALAHIQRADVDSGGWTLSPYSPALLEQEMSLLPEWFLTGLLEMTLSSADRALLTDTFGALIRSAQEQPQVFVHRDYHSRNLMLLDDGGLGVIDFQDAVVGPVTYDLVSLLRDCYVAWAPDRVTAWALEFRDHAGLEVSDEVFKRWFDWMGLQRHLKVLGIFARLWLRDGKPGYLQDLPLVMHYTLSVAASYAQTAEFAGWFEQRVVPLARAQTWYREAEIRV